MTTGSAGARGRRVRAVWGPARGRLIVKPRQCQRRRMRVLEDVRMPRWKDEGYELQRHLGKPRRSQSLFLTQSSDSQPGGDSQVGQTLACGMPAWQDARRHPELDGPWSGWWSDRHHPVFVLTHHVEPFSVFRAGHVCVRDRGNLVQCPVSSGPTLGDVPWGVWDHDRVGDGPSPRRRSD